MPINRPARQLSPSSKSQNQRNREEIPENQSQPLVRIRDSADAIAWQKSVTTDPSFIGAG
jgi:hypothetical protein